ncbi:MAG: undecaprenyl diphosphate synthase family protein, partial [Candidatus Izemoplasmataceae bacterium]
IQLEYINEFVRINDTQNGRHCSNLIYRYLKSELFHRRVSLAYAEFYFTKTHWPAFNEKALYKAIRSYQNRNRKFGGLKG